MSPSENDASPYRPLVIVAHPDDEIIGAGALLCELPHARIIHVTDGAPADLRDARSAGFSSADGYAAERRRESERALAIAGISSSAIRCLGFTDQTLSQRLLELSSALAELILEERPDWVLSHAYEGGHPDHDSITVALHIARTSLEAQFRFPLIECGGYHGANSRLTPYKFIPHPNTREIRITLERERRELKIAMLREFKTQSQTLAPFLSPVHETFRLAPLYDFSKPPHSGKLHYERALEPMFTGEHWRALVQSVLRNYR